MVRNDMSNLQNGLVQFKDQMKAKNVHNSLNCTFHNNKRPQA